MGVDIFKKLATARPTGGGDFFRQGKGVAIVRALKHDTLYEGETFIAEMEIESSQSYPNAVDRETKAVVTANPPGTSPSWLAQYEKFPEVALNNVMGFLYGLMGETQESMIQAAAEAKQSFEDYFKACYAKFTSKANPCRGMRVSFETYQRETKDKKKELTLVRWRHIPQTAAEIAAVRARLDGAVQAQESVTKAAG